MESFIKTQAVANKTEILVGLKHALRQRLPQSEVDPIFSLTYDNDNQFFLKSPDGIIWARVFYQPFCQRFGEMLHKEIVRLNQAFKQRIFPYIFFPNITSGGELIENLPSKAVSFEYSFDHKQPHRSIELKNWPPVKSQAEPPASFRVKEATPSAPYFNFFKRSKLSREELSDLIDLSLEVRNS